jgi:hypothetical protein
MLGPMEILLLLIGALVVVPFWKICAKVGFSPWLGLLVVIPIVNIIFFYYLAFSKWPLHRQSAEDK